MRLGRCVAQMTALEVNKFKYMLELIAMDILEREVDPLVSITKVHRLKPGLYGKKGMTN